MRLLIFGKTFDRHDSLNSFIKSKLAVIDETADVDEAVDLTHHYEYEAVVMRVFDTYRIEFDLIRRLRKSGFRAPIVAVANTLAESARLHILEAGVDDLIVGAPSYEETFLRIQNHIRRNRGFQDSSLSVGNIDVNMNAKKVFVGAREVAVTKKEYQIIELLALRKGCVLSKEAILDHLYGGLDEPNAKIIDVFICKIRKKLLAADGQDVLVTNWGRGYMMADQRPQNMVQTVTAPGIQARIKTTASLAVA
ncbi:response regulator transcription factor [Acidiphilium multivorum]|uniref:response regulator transcription factor n=1 Tax=Acidiphilium TaxID=522 RepID=UPI00258619EB|nr:response regulator transcription factor [Acidiphilium sp.]